VGRTGLLVALCRPATKLSAKYYAARLQFRRLLLRFERLSQLHYAFETLAYTMINSPLLLALTGHPVPIVTASIAP
jgi:hypothetical protein